MKITILLFAIFYLYVGISPGQSLAIQDTHQTGQHTITPEDIVSIREPRELQISPDGKRVAFRIKEPADPRFPLLPRAVNIWTVPTDGGESPRPVIPDLKNAASPLWSPDGLWLAFLSDRGEPAIQDQSGTIQVYVLPSKGGKAQRLTSVAGGVESYLWSPDSKMIAFIARDQPSDEERQKQAAGDDAVQVDHDFRYSRLWIANLSDRTSVQITKQDFEINEFAWSPNGREIAVVAAKTQKPEDSLLLSLHIIDRSTGGITRTLSPNVSSIRGLLKWSPDGAWITFLESPPTKEFAAWLSVVSANGRGTVRSLTKDYLGTIIALGWTNDSKGLFAQGIEGTRQVLLRIDAFTGAITKLTDILQTTWEYSFSSNGAAIAYTAQTEGSPSDVWAWTAENGPRKITDLNPQTKLWRQGKVREVAWKNSKDGLNRKGIVITPPYYKAGTRYPTVVNTHPGDTAWWVGLHAKSWAWGQLLASNGYVVFLPNTRGIDGEGWRLHATTADWGGMAYQDLIDGVDYLVAQGIADPNRLGIGGWSNGGFMTEYAITRTSRFKAAVAQSGHANFFSLHGTSPGMHASHHVSTSSDPYHDRTWYDEHSPITLIKNCRTPTLLLHGVNDRGVPVGQAYEFYTGLKDVGVEAELVLYPREGHNIQEYTHQLDLQKRVLAWFDKYLKPNARRARLSR